MEGVTLTRLASRILAYRLVVLQVLNELGLEPEEADWNEIRSDTRVVEGLAAIHAEADTGWPEELLNLTFYNELKELHEDVAIALIMEEIREHQKEITDPPNRHKQKSTSMQKIRVHCYGRAIEAWIDLDLMENLLPENSYI